MKLLKILFFLFFIFLIIVVLGLGYIGVIPGLSSKLGTDKPRNLGVKHTKQDLDSAQKKLQQKLLENYPEQKTFDLTASVPIETFLTQEEYSAHIERLHPVSDVQIKFTGEAFQMSGRINKAKIPVFLKTWNLALVNQAEILTTINKYFPSDPNFYLAGTGKIENNKLTLNLAKAELGRLPIPIGQAEQALSIYIETIMNQIKGFSVQDFHIENGQLYFKGTAVSEIPAY